MSCNHSSSIIFNNNNKIRLFIQNIIALLHQIQSCHSAIGYMNQIKILKGNLTSIQENINKARNHDQYVIFISPCDLFCFFHTIRWITLKKLLCEFLIIFLLIISQINKHNCLLFRISPIFHIWNMYKYYQIVHSRVKADENHADFYQCM